jgi:hypothetical protein
MQPASWGGCWLTISLPATVTARELNLHLM